MNKINKCKICGKKSFEFLYSLKDKNIKNPGKFILNKCNNCEILFLNPPPSKKELEKVYSKKDYYSLKKINTIEESKKTRLRIFLYKLYFGKKKNLFLKFLFSPIKFTLRSINISKNKRYLDIGSGSGQFIYDMKKLGINILGIEPGDFDKITSKKEKLKIINSNLFEAKLPSSSADIITINHVLEHLQEPVKTIKEIKRILKKNGELIIGVPNSNSLAYKIFKKNWYQLDVPRHLFNFSNKNLSQLLEKEGFEIQKIRYNSRPSQFVISLLFYLNTRNRNKFLIVFLDFVFLPLTWLVNYLKIGDQIEIICIKK